MSRIGSANKFPSLVAARAVRIHPPLVPVKRGNNATVPPVQASTLANWLPVLASGLDQSRFTPSQYNMMAATNTDE
ncbi:hypothetical protein SAMN04490248_10342 [Salinihabitans flavidus]|uniref:Uncharacterized protein n=1 Tax=Salinihabitans flavidus TaxID=569882 RepID=A0A1H8N7G5_9RHOB|nr:hypothetical protein SAMN04490248_10342 [Salinihabitans flavidus]